jgi:hypothetical protein
MHVANAVVELYQDVIQQFRATGVESIEILRRTEARRPSAPGEPIQTRERRCRIDHKGDREGPLGEGDVDCRCPRFDSVGQQ